MCLGRFWKFFVMKSGSILQDNTGRSADVFPHDGILSSIAY